MPMKKQHHVFTIKSTLVALVLGAVLAASVAYSWDAVWHGTDWMVAGETIRAQEVAENFEYLKEQMDYIYALIGD